MLGLLILHSTVNVTLQNELDEKEFDKNEHDENELNAAFNIPRLGNVTIR